MSAVRRILARPIFDYIRVGRLVRFRLLLGALSVRRVHRLWSVRALWIFPIAEGGPGLLSILGFQVGGG